jgi:DNA-binding NtrC family response regulator
VIVDDDPFMLMLVRGILRAAFSDCRVTEHRDGETAVWHIMSDPPDLVLAGDELGRMDGAELTSKIRSRGVESPVIMISNHPSANAKADAAGVTAFIEATSLMEDLVPTVMALTTVTPSQLESA